jgi:hypothetical protein
MRHHGQGVPVLAAVHARVRRSLGDAGRAGVKSVLGQCAQFGTP